MRKRIFNRTTASGIGAWLLSFLPFTQGGNKMNLTTWVLVGIGTVLFLWGVIQKPQHRLRRSELNELIQKREPYLNPLKVNIKERLNLANSLIKEASQSPLEEYRKKYAPTWFRATKEIGVYSWIFAKQRFMVDNLYYELLKNNNPQYSQLLQEYKFIYAQIEDKKLKDSLTGLWWLEHRSNSMAIFALLSKNHPEIKNSTKGLRIARLGEKYNFSALEGQLKTVMTRIEELLDGEEDE